MGVHLLSCILPEYKLFSQVVLQLKARHNINNCHMHIAPALFRMNFSV